MLAAAFTFRDPKVKVGEVSIGFVSSNDKAHRAVPFVTQREVFVIEQPQSLMADDGPGVKIGGQQAAALEAGNTRSHEAVQDAEERPVHRGRDGERDDTNEIGGRKEQRTGDPYDGDLYVFLGVVPQASMACIQRALVVMDALKPDYRGRNWKKLLERARTTLLDPTKRLSYHFERAKMLDRPHETNSSNSPYIESRMSRFDRVSADDLFVPGSPKRAQQTAKNLGLYSDDAEDGPSPPFLSVRAGGCGLLQPIRGESLEMKLKEAQNLLSVGGVNNDMLTTNVELMKQIVSHMDQHYQNRESAGIHLKDFIEQYRESVSVRSKAIVDMLQTDEELWEQVFRAADPCVLREQSLFYYAAINADIAIRDANHTMNTEILTADMVLLTRQMSTQSVDDKFNTMYDCIRSLLTFVAYVNRYYYGDLDVGPQEWNDIDPFCRHTDGTSFWPVRDTCLHFRLVWDMTVAIPNEGDRETLYRHMLHSREDEFMRYLTALRQNIPLAWERNPRVLYRKLILLMVLKKKDAPVDDAIQAAINTLQEIASDPSTEGFLRMTGKSDTEIGTWFNESHTSAWTDMQHSLGIKWDDGTKVPETVAEVDTTVSQIGLPDKEDFVDLLNAEASVYGLPEAKESSSVKAMLSLSRGRDESKTGRENIVVATAGKDGEERDEQQDTPQSEGGGVGASRRSGAAPKGRRIRIVSRRKGGGAGSAKVRDSRAAETARRNSRTVETESHESEEERPSAKRSSMFAKLSGPAASDAQQSGLEDELKNKWNEILGKEVDTWANAAKIAWAQTTENVLSQRTGTDQEWDAAFGKIRALFYSSDGSLAKYSVEMPDLNTQPPREPSPSTDSLQKWKGQWEESFRSELTEQMRPVDHHKDAYVLENRIRTAWSQAWNNYQVPPDEHFDTAYTIACVMLHKVAATDIEAYKEIRREHPASFDTGTPQSQRGNPLRLTQGNARRGGLSRRSSEESKAKKKVSFASADVGADTAVSSSGSPGSGVFRDRRSSKKSKAKKKVSFPSTEAGAATDPSGSSDRGVSRDGDDISQPFGAWTATSDFPKTDVLWSNPFATGERDAPFRPSAHPRERVMRIRQRQLRGRQRGWGKEQGQKRTSSSSPPLSSAPPSTPPSSSSQSPPLSQSASVPWTHDDSGVDGGGSDGDGAGGGDGGGDGDGDGGGDGGGGESDLEFFPWVDFVPEVIIPSARKEPTPNLNALRSANAHNYFVVDQTWIEFLRYAITTWKEAFHVEDTKSPWEAWKDGYVNAWAAVGQLSLEQRISVRVGEHSTKNESNNGLVNMLVRRLLKEMVNELWHEWMEGGHRGKIKLRVPFVNKPDRRAALAHRPPNRESLPAWYIAWIREWADAFRRRFNGVFDTAIERSTTLNEFMGNMLRGWNEAVNVTWTQHPVIPERITWEFALDDSYREATQIFYDSYWNTVRLPWDYNFVPQLPPVPSAVPQEEAPQPHSPPAIPDDLYGWCLEWSRRWSEALEGTNAKNGTLNEVNEKLGQLWDSLWMTTWTTQAPPLPFEEMWEYAIQWSKTYAQFHFAWLIQNLFTKEKEAAEQRAIDAVHQEERRRRIIEEQRRYQEMAEAEAEEEQQRQFAAHEEWRRADEIAAQYRAAQKLRRERIQRESDEMKREEAHRLFNMYKTQAVQDLRAMELRGKSWGELTKLGAQIPPMEVRGFGESDEGRGSSHGRDVWRSIQQSLEREARERFPREATRETESDVVSLLPEQAAQEPPTPGGPESGSGRDGVDDAFTFQTYTTWLQMSTPDAMHELTLVLNNQSLPFGTDDVFRIVSAEEAQPNDWGLYASNAEAMQQQFKAILKEAIEACPFRIEKMFSHWIHERFGAVNSKSLMKKTLKQLLNEYHTATEVIELSQMVSSILKPSSPHLKTVRERLRLRYDIHEADVNHRIINTSLKDFVSDLDSVFFTNDDTGKLIWTCALYPVLLHATESVGPGSGTRLMLQFFRPGDQGTDHWQRLVEGTFYLGYKDFLPAVALADGRVSHMWRAIAHVPNENLTMMHRAFLASANAQNKIQLETIREQFNEASPTLANGAVGFGTIATLFGIPFWPETRRAMDLNAMLSQQLTQGYNPFVDSSKRVNLWDSPYMRTRFIVPPSTDDRRATNQVAQRAIGYKHSDYPNIIKSERFQHPKGLRAVGSIIVAPTILSDARYRALRQTLINLVQREHNDFMKLNSSPIVSTQERTENLTQWQAAQQRRGSDGSSESKLFLTTWTSIATYLEHSIVLVRQVDANGTVTGVLQKLVGQIQSGLGSFLALHSTNDPNVTIQPETLKTTMRLVAQVLVQLRDLNKMPQLRQNGGLRYILLAMCMLRDIVPGDHVDGLDRFVDENLVG